MPTITLETVIDAPISICFDLSRSIDLHAISTRHSGQQAIAGVTTGLIGYNETVTWRAKHFFLWLNISSRITVFDQPRYFAEEMEKRSFIKFKHERYFEETAEGSIMVDVFNYTSPFGALGIMLDKLFLQKYITALLQKKNRVIKHFAETGRWKSVLKGYSSTPRSYQPKPDRLVLAHA
ncbi:SRPBCC family protein [Pontibacter sp. FD36]|uniref:SRPBCC family protein n=1 Tax=Pontibacter sp. FD36 TaxID=2789860 RepID=UPI0018A9F1F0|nr:SRPBCC family protein [Pontibacter sp. FD36]MBF8962986.1 SRPBCC family protein [Pontibacter sp. FD36]